ncbi:proton-coupled zinc antiporter SLC30A9, mitochondrial-like [Gordionus sp. m RMFG-2023]|uniref:proton-coupled zinc antiporter SLC30A9, mitochondrial-like n=1 Tax=Gordionus sp. m RMFG-2023 TaxID=3053472 RepID=UPI0031FC3327
MSEYLLKPKDLENLPVFQRRSPYEYRKINVYLRADIERRAMQVWGNHENLTKEILKRREENYKKFDFHKYTSISRAMKKYLGMIGIKNATDMTPDYNSQNDINASIKKPVTSSFLSLNTTSHEPIHSLFRDTSFIIWTAVTINFFNFVGKTVACIHTGSHSLFAEAIHSLADTLNQLILAFGIKASHKKADILHPYGYLNMKYVSCLISGVGIFCFGCGLSIYHGISAILDPHTVESLNWVFMILACSFISEGATLILSINSVRRNANKRGLSVLDYVLSGQDPSVNVLLLEDLASVIGVSIASLCLSLNYYHSHHYKAGLSSETLIATENSLSTLPENVVVPIYDAIGSLSIGILLGVVASFIIYTNSAALVGKSIPLKAQQQICRELENDVMVRAVHDVKATTMGGNLVKFKAEVDIDGREITLAYLDTQDLFTILKEMQNMQGTNEVENFLLKHGENIVDLLGAEIDRIEQTLKKKHPEMRHVDLEVL